MYKISGMICTLNEEDNIVDCIKSLKGVDEVVVCDGGSTDKTEELARKAGAKFFKRHDTWENPTQEDREDFKKRFGWYPSFKVGDKLITGPENLIKAVKFTSYDWVIGIDADERLTWDEKEVRKLMPHADQISCDYHYDHNPDGTPTWTMKLIRLRNKKFDHFTGGAHGTIIPEGKQLFTDKMKVDHYPKWDNKRSWGNRSYVLPNLEYSVMKNDNPRQRFYLAREYFGFKRYKETIRMVDEYFKIQNWWKEMAIAHYIKAQSYWYWVDGPKNRGDIAREEALEAVRINPSYKEALNFMGVVYYEPFADKWRRLAKTADNEDVLFPV